MGEESGKEWMHVRVWPNHFAVHLELTQHRSSGVWASSLQACLTPCSPMDCGPSGSSVHGILQARILEWLAISSSRGSSCLQDQTWIFCGSRIAGRFFTTGPLGKTYWSVACHFFSPFTDKLWLCRCGDFLNSGPRAGAYVGKPKAQIWKPVIHM